MHNLTTNNSFFIHKNVMWPVTQEYFEYKMHEMRQLYEYSSVKCNINY